MGEPLRLALVSSSSLVRAGLRAGLESADDIRIVIGAGSLAELRDAGFGGAQVVIVDAPSGSDMAALADAAAETDDGPPLLLLAPEPPGAAADALALGCSVLPRETAIDTLVAARAAAAGLVVGTHAMLASAIRFGSAPVAAFDLEPLTPREREVLQQMSLGLGNREIADALHISSHTAKFHVAQVIAKLDASSRTHAVAKGLRAGLVEL